MFTRFFYKLITCLALFTVAAALMSTSSEISQASSVSSPLLTYIQTQSDHLIEAARPYFQSSESTEPVKINASVAATQSRARTPVNWDEVADSDLDPDEIEATIKDSDPSSIVYFKGTTRNQYFPNPGTVGDGTTLFISDKAAVDAIKDERLKEMENNLAILERNGGSGANAFQKANTQRDLAESDYELFQLSPGLRDDRTTIIDEPADIHRPIYGPDSDTSLSEAEARLTVLSLGHGGEILLKVQEKGFITDSEGFDFTIYENVFRYGSGKIYQEFAKVGISAGPTPTNFYWFSCNPAGGILKGCAGAVPTDEGGDQFDLAGTGISEVRFIKIKDLGINKNMKGGTNKEGFDFDAGRLTHAITND